MKKIILLAITFSSIYAQADIYTCQFGNPFSEVTYDSKEKKLSSSTTIGNSLDVKVTTNVSMKRTATGEINLVTSDDKVLVILKHTNAGSDGITNLIYPFSATAEIDENNKGNGACETNYLRAEKPEATESEENI